MIELLAASAGMDQEELMGERRSDMISMVDLPGLAGYVQSRRLEVYLRYDQLAARLGTDLKWLFALEDGLLPGIEPAMLVRLAVALEVDQSILIHQAQLPPGLTAPGHSRIHITELSGQPTPMTEDLLLFSDRQTEDDRKHVTQILGNDLPDDQTDSAGTR